MRQWLRAAVSSMAVLAALGCGHPGQSAEETVIARSRAGLSPEDQRLVNEQEWCVVSTDERLGSMGKPIKVMINDQPVFLCCAGCRKKAEANPDQTLATLEQLKEKSKAESKPGDNG